MSNRTSRTRPAARLVRLALAAVVGLTCLFAVGRQAGATPKTAAATASVQHLERRPAGPTTGPDATKSLQPRCSSNSKHVIGGGGVVDDGGAHRVMLTGMQPFDASPDGFTVVAKAPPGFTSNWTLTAYVICADAAPLTGWEINPGPITNVPASSAIQSATAQETCSTSSKKVIGTGAFVSQSSVPTSEVGLQTFRSDADRNAAKAWAREDANGFSGTWSMAAFAICTDPVPGTGISGVLREGSEADVLCFSGPTSYVAGAAGGAGPSAVFLQRVEPSANRRRLDVATTGADPTGIIAQAICVPATLA
ncbi:MAG TPA: hypothetical protein VH912_30020 [Streptosporangiaceae bacterium]